ncbi:hypothetical protein CICLE_v10017616mg, partial [Citrus x clementina]
CVVNLETEEEERKIEARKFWEWERGFLPLFIISSSTLGTVLDFFSSISGKVSLLSIYFVGDDVIIFPSIVFISSFFFFFLLINQSCLLQFGYGSPSWLGFNISHGGEM